MENVTTIVWARVNELSVTFRSIFLVMVVRLLGCQEEVGCVLRGSGLALLLGYLGDGFGLQIEVREVNDHGGRVSQVLNSVVGGPGFQWKTRHEMGTEA